MLADRAVTDGATRGDYAKSYVAASAAVEAPMQQARGAAQAASIAYNKLIGERGGVLDTLVARGMTLEAAMAEAQKLWDASVLGSHAADADAAVIAAVKPWGISEDDRRRLLQVLQAIK